MLNNNYKLCLVMVKLRQIFSQPYALPDADLVEFGPKDLGFVYPGTKPKGSGCMCLLLSCKQPALI